MFFIELNDDKSQVEAALEKLGYREVDNPKFNKFRWPHYVNLIDKDHFEYTNELPFKNRRTLKDLEEVLRSGKFHIDVRGKSEAEKTAILEGLVSEGYELAADLEVYMEFDFYVNYLAGTNAPSTKLYGTSRDRPLCPVRLEREKYKSHYLCNVPKDEFEWVTTPTGLSTKPGIRLQERGEL